jgi:hypothetical protein
VPSVSADSPIAHRVHAGGNDICEAFGLKPGCDANYSLNAIVFADGTVRGQYSDRFGQLAGGGGIHATIDCVNVIGNQAWVSGTITQGWFDPFGTGERIDLAGFDVVTSVIDNGTSANDPPDQISFSLPGFEIDCYEAPTELPALPFFAMFDAPQNQVTIR